MTLPSQLRNTTSHSDLEDPKQKIDGDTGSVNFANIHSSHQPESSVNTTVVEITSRVLGGCRGRHSFIASTDDQPAPQGSPTEVLEKELTGLNTLGPFGGLGPNGESTALMTLTEQDESNDRFGNSVASTAAQPTPGERLTEGAIPRVENARTVRRFVGPHRIDVPDGHGRVARGPRRFPPYRT